MLSRLKTLFSRQRGPTSREEQSVTLNLPLPPTPENAPALAQKLVETALKVDGLTLDYSVGSLSTVDARILAFRAQGATSVEMPETLFMFGCYFGEVMVRHLGGKWFVPQASVAGFAVLAVELDTGLLANPIGKVFKLLENGQEDSTAWLFETLAAEKARRAGLQGGP